MPEKIPCIICNTPATLALENFDGYIKDEKFNAYHCTSCDTSFVWPHKVDNKIYDYIYSQADIVPGYNRYAMYASKIKKQKNPLNYLAGKEGVYFAVREILKQKVDKPQKILEVGSGLGYLTYAIKQEGYNIIGLDISMDAVAKAKKQFGNYYVCEDVYQYAVDNEGEFDLVILTEVIEHIQDPGGFSDILIKLLKVGGKLIISTPNKSAYPQNECWNTELPPVHLTWFSEDSFKVFSQQKELSCSFFDFTDFNKKHLDYTKFKYYEIYNKRHKRSPTLNCKGELLVSAKQMTENKFMKAAKYSRNFCKSLIERLIVLSPLMDKKHLNRSSYLCVVLQKKEK